LKQIEPVLVVPSRFQNKLAASGAEMSLQSPTNQQQQLQQQQQQQQKSPGHQQLTGEQSALMQTLPSDQPHGGQFQALINAGQPLALQQAARSITPLPASATRQSSSPSVANPVSESPL